MTVTKFNENYAIIHTNILYTIWLNIQLFTKRNGKKKKKIK